MKIFGPGIGHRLNLPSSSAGSNKCSEVRFFDRRRDLAAPRALQLRLWTGARSGNQLRRPGPQPSSAVGKRRPPRVAHTPGCRAVTARDACAAPSRRETLPEMKICDWSSRFRLLPPPRAASLYFNASAAGAKVAGAVVAGAVVAGAGFRYLSHHASQRS
jgi:hypothetical protein